MFRSLQIVKYKRIIIIIVVVVVVILYELIKEVIFIFDNNEWNMDEAGKFKLSQISVSENKV
jgi:hypothetical protein